MNQTGKDMDNLESGLEENLKCIKERCNPPEKFWFKTFYFLLFLCSLIPMAAHNMAFLGMDFEKMRMAHGLLPLPVLNLRDTLIPYLLPFVTLTSFFLSFKLKLLRSASWLAGLTLLLFFATGVYTLFVALFIVTNPA